MFFSIYIYYTRISGESQIFIKTIPRWENLAEEVEKITSWNRVEKMSSWNEKTRPRPFFCATCTISQNCAPSFCA